MVLKVTGENPYKKLSTGLKGAGDLSRLLKGNGPGIQGPGEKKFIEAAMKAIGEKK
jgi:hypothetical protein